MLSLVDGEDAAADHLGRVRRLVEAEADDGDRHVGGQSRLVEGDEGGPERHTDAQRPVQGTEVVEEDQYDDERYGAEQPGVGPAHRAQHRASGEPGECQQDAAEEPQGGAERGDFEGDEEAVEDGGAQEPVTEAVPLVEGVGHQPVQDLRDEHEDDGGDDPPAGAAQWLNSLGGQLV